MSDNYSFLFHALGLISTIWMMLNILSLINYMDDPMFKYMGRTITLKPRFFLPFALVIIYIFWLFLG